MSASHVTPAVGSPPVRLAGLLYLVIILCGLMAELLLRAPLIKETAEETARSIAAALPAFRASLGADLLMVAADVALALLFYELLRHVSAPLARAALVLRLVQAVLIAAGLVRLAAVPGMIAAGEAALAHQMISLHAIGYDVGLIFFGGNALVMVTLLAKSGGVPRVILVGLALSGLVYIAGRLARLLAPGLIPVIQPAYLVPMLSETAFCLWLLVRARI